MYIFLSVIVIAIFSTIIIRMFMKDHEHDLIIQAGKFMFSIKRHDNE